MAWMQPTIPAKQKRWSIELRVLTVEATASERAEASVTSTARPKIRDEGKSFAKARIEVWEVRRVDSRSQRAIPEAPCSRRARAAERPRVPAPPVTVYEISMEIYNLFANVLYRLCCPRWRNEPLIALQHLDSEEAEPVVQSWTLRSHRRVS